MLLKSTPCFTTVKEGGKNDSSIYLDFCCLWDASPISHIYAESAKFNATSEANMRYDVYKLLVACDNFGLTISTKKTAVMH